MAQPQKACLSEFAPSGPVNRMRPEGISMYDYDDSWEEYDESTIWYYARNDKKHKGLGGNKRLVYIPVNRKSKSQGGSKQN